MTDLSTQTIHRRKYLTAICASTVVTGIAGCSSDSSTSGGTDGDSGETSQVEPSAEVVNTETFSAPFFSDGGGSDVPWIGVEVENESDTPHRQVNIESRLRAEDDSVIEVRERFAVALPPDTVWHYYHRFDESIDASDIADVDSTVTEQETGILGETIEDAEVLNSSFSFDGSSVNISGEVDIGDVEPSRVSILAYIYDAEEQFRGAMSAVELDPSATDTIAFDEGSVGYRTPPSDPDPDDYQLTVISGSV